MSTNDSKLLYFVALHTGSFCFVLYLLFEGIIVYSYHKHAAFVNQNQAPFTVLLSFAVPHENRRKFSLMSYIF